MEPKAYWCSGVVVYFFVAVIVDHHAVSCWFYQQVTFPKSDMKLEQSNEEFFELEQQLDGIKRVSKQVNQEGSMAFCTKFFFSPISQWPIKGHLHYYPLEKAGLASSTTAMLASPDR